MLQSSATRGILIKTGCAGGRLRMLQSSATRAIKIMTHGVCVTNDPDYYCNSHFKPPSDREIVWHGYVGAPDGPQETWIVKGKCGDLSVWFS